MAMEHVSTSAQKSYQWTGQFHRQQVPSALGRRRREDGNSGSNSVPSPTLLSSMAGPKGRDFKKNPKNPITIIYINTIIFPVTIK